MQNLPFGRTTAKGDTIYLHVFDWPKGSLELSGLDPRVSRVTLLAGGKPLKFNQTADRLTIRLPDQPPDPHVSVVTIITNQTVGPSRDRSLRRLHPTHVCYVEGR